MENTITYVAMDTHKKQRTIALHYPCQEEIVEFTIDNTVRGIKKMVNKISKGAVINFSSCLPVTGMFTEMVNIGRKNIPSGCAASNLQNLCSQKSSRVILSG